MEIVNAFKKKIKNTLFMYWNMKFSNVRDQIGLFLLSYCAEALIHTIPTPLRIKDLSFVLGCCSHGACLQQYSHGPSAGWAIEDMQAAIGLGRPSHKEFLPTHHMTPLHRSFRQAPFPLDPDHLQIHDVHPPSPHGYSRRWGTILLLLTTSVQKFSSKTSFDSWKHSVE